MYAYNTIVHEIDLDLNAHLDEIIHELKLENSDDVLELFSHAADRLGEPDWYEIRNYCDSRLAALSRDKLGIEMDKENLELRLRVEALEKQLKEKEHAQTA